MKTNNWLLVLAYLVIFLLLANGLLLAQEEADPVETIHIRAGHLEYVQEKIAISKGVNIIKGETKLSSPEGVYYQEEDRAELEGGVKLIYSEGVIEARKLQAWLKDDNYIFQEEVKLLQKMQEDDEFQLLAPYLEISLKDNSFLASQGVSINYKGRILRGEKVRYNHQEETLELFENVSIQEENGDWVKSKTAVFYLQTEEFIAEGEVELELKIESN